MKKFVEEFRSFILRGNVMDMAVGVIIGSAFASIVTALTNDFINPLINSIGGAEFGGRLHLPWTPEVGGQYILWGDFLTAVVNFIIMAFVLFLMLKFINKLMDVSKKKLKKGKEEEVKQEEKVPTETELLQEILKELKKKSK